MIGQTGNYSTLRNGVSAIVLGKGVRHGSVRRGEVR